MNDLIPISEMDMGRGLVQTVNGRRLHEHLGTRKDFSDWVRYQIERCKFIENKERHGRKWTLLATYMGKSTCALRFYYDRHMRHLNIASIRTGKSPGRPPAENTLDMTVNIKLAIPQHKEVTSAPPHKDYTHIHDPWEDTECQT